MIRINLLSEKKPARAKAAAVSVGVGGGTQNALLIIILVGTIGFVGWQYWSLSREKTRLAEENRKADAELVRLEGVRKKGDEYKKERELYERKVNLITQLKKNQSVPVHVLDQISRNLPDFLWLDSMREQGNVLTIRGKATNYNAVANFYNNLAASQWFKNVTQGAINEAPEGVNFSLTCEFVAPKEETPETAG